MSGKRGAGGGDAGTYDDVVLDGGRKEREGERGKRLHVRGTYPASVLGALAGERQRVSDGGQTKAKGEGILT